MHAVRMNSIVLFVFLLLPVLGCTTSKPAGEANAVITVEQLPGSEFAVIRGAALSVAYRISVRNTSAAPITLHRVEMTTGPRSPYRIERGEPIDVDLTIAPGAEESTVFDAWVIPSEPHSGNLVHLYGVAHFRSSEGPVEVDFRGRFHEPE